MYELKEESLIPYSKVIDLSLFINENAYELNTLTEEGTKRVVIDVFHNASVEIIFNVCGKIMLLMQLFPLKQYEDNSTTGYMTPETLI